MHIDILGQEIRRELSIPDLTGANTDWSKIGTLDLGQISVVRDLTQHAPESFVILDDVVKPDTWVVKAMPDLYKGFPRDFAPVVELSNLTARDQTAAIKVTPALAMDMEQGKALTGVAREIQRAFLETPGYERRWSKIHIEEIHRERRVFRNRVIEFETDPSLTGPAQPVMVPVMRLHCPKHVGCKASEEYAVEQGTEVDAKLSFVALGAAAETSTNLRYSSQWDTADGECLQYLVPAEIVTEHGIYVFNGAPVEDSALVSRTTIRFVGEDGCQEAIPKHEDGCQQPAAAIQRDRRLMGREHIAAGSRSHCFNPVSVVRGKLDLGLAPPGWPSLKFGYERTVATTFTRTVSLVPDATYLAYTPEPPADSRRPEHAEILWTTL